VQHGDPAADVSDRDREIDGLVGRLGDPAGTEHFNALPIRVVDFLRRIVEPRGDEQRP
jgi:hypothetical protein